MLLIKTEKQKIYAFFFGGKKPMLLILKKA